MRTDERRRISRLTRAALAVRKAQGRSVGEVPWGYRRLPEHGKLAPEPREAAIHQRVLDLRAAGLSLRAIVARCADDGLVSRAGRPFRLTQIARLVRARPAFGGHP